MLQNGSPGLTELIFFPTICFDLLSFTYLFLNALTTVVRLLGVSIEDLCTAVECTYLSHALFATLHKSLVLLFIAVTNLLL
jgi:hypothetical protein